jgi:hypothetical protein
MERCLTIIRHQLAASELDQFNLTGKDSVSLEILCDGVSTDGVCSSNDNAPLKANQNPDTLASI